MMTATKTVCYAEMNKSSAVAEMAAQCCATRIFAFEWGYLFLTHCSSVISENITINHILPKIKILLVTFLLQTVRV